MSKRHASGGDMAERSKPRAIPIVLPWQIPQAGRRVYQACDGACLEFATSPVRSAETTANPRSG
jgi:hypothetical protein